MYERRIELSMTRMLREFKKQQIIRRIEQNDITYNQAVGGTEALTGKKVNLKKQSQYDRSESGVQRAAKTDLKKQSQFSPDLMGVSPFVKEVYDDLSTAGIGENKANKACSELGMGPFDGPSPSELLRKSHNIPAPPTG
jgi:hypothetical protein